MVNKVYMNAMIRLRQSAGFTLIEIVIVLAIVAILAAAGLPSYQNYIARSDRNLAKESLQVCAQAMERHFLQASSYLGAADGGDTGVIDVCPTQSPLDGTPKYNVTVFAATGTTYTLRATPIATGSQKDDGMLAIQHTGRRWWDTDDDDAFGAGEDSWSDH
jgi:type IV pilus assembly protein PilE